MQLVDSLSIEGIGICVVVLCMVHGLILDRWNQLGTTDYIKYRAKSSLRDATLHYLPPLPGVRANRIIIMAKLEKEDTGFCHVRAFRVCSVVCTRDGQKIYKPQSAGSLQSTP